MGFFGKLFGKRSPEERAQREEQQRQQARAAWAMAHRGGDLEAMQQAAHVLADARLGDEYVRALESIAERFPDERSTQLNNIGVHYYFEQEYERALTYYTRSYLAEEEGGSAAESNILEVCREIAKEANTEQDEVRALVRYFKICTRQIDPDATIENIDLLSVFRADVRSLAAEVQEKAQELLEEVEDILVELDDATFVAHTERELDEIAKVFGLERTPSHEKQNYGAEV